MKNNKNALKEIWIILIILTFFLIFLTLYFYISHKENITKDLTEVSEISNSWNISKIDYEYWYQLSSKWEYKELIDYYESIVNSNSTWQDKLSLVWAYLAYEDYYYKDEYSAKALSILDTLVPDDRINEFEISFNKWYANELAWNYEKAKKIYQEATNLDLYLWEKAVLYNQIWNVYDLEWDYFTANEYYVEAENLWLEDEDVFINRATYEFRQWNFSVAEEYLQKALPIVFYDTFKEAKVYFLLAWISLLKEDKEQSIVYSNLWIEAQPNYPYNYLNLAIIHDNLDETDKSKEYLQKALEIYPNILSVAKSTWFYSDELINKFE
jgi:tetratricopeptide (TPR) repeat protein